MENFEFEIARRFVNETHVPIFLTGKAGTGKTTFLREVIGKTSKKSVVVAPTGVAAINAGGVTIHSMFGFPTKGFIPSNENVDPNLANNRQMLTRHFHYRKEKIQVFQELELLVLDEVSMVRADMLDAIDFALQYVRRNNQPFGGVQVLFIGDMYQLPPVVRDHEWPLMSQYYSSPYFFDSLVFKSIEPVYIELKKIYRQTDRNFINILNNIRHQDFQQEDYETLKEHFRPDFVPDEPGFITLTTHNRKADEMNEAELRKLDGEEVVFDAKVEGEFSDNMYPTENLLRLKKGAQVMFVKNDTSGSRRYFNGKIGIVEKINPYADEGEELTVRFPETNETIFVEKEVWENVRYSMNAEENKLEQNRIGSFTQYPLRLAWAITIHKSQGLTFEKAVIDAGDSFAPGQVYVALSRCTSMEHLVLRSMISGRSIVSDPRIVQFTERTMNEMVLENRLVDAKEQFEFDELKKVFEFIKIKEYLSQWFKEVSKIKTLENNTKNRIFSATLRHLDSLQEVSQKFQKQMDDVFNSDVEYEEKIALLRDRCSSAVGYFSRELFENVIRRWEEEVKDKKFKAKMKKYVLASEEMVLLLWNKMNDFYGCRLGDAPVFQGETLVPEKAPTVAKVEKGDTFADTLTLFKDGKTIDEIAALRNLAVSTIESHLGKWLQKKEIQLTELISTEKIASIQKQMDKFPSAGAGILKGKLGEDVSFSEIRWVMQAKLK